MKTSPVPLDAKPDWPEAARRWEAFWRDEVPEDRVLMSIWTPRADNPYPKVPPPDDLARYHTDLDAFLARQLHRVYQQEYWAEAVPAAWPSITGGLLGILLGGKLRPMENGVIWSDPWIEDWDAVEDIVAAPDNLWALLVQEQMALLAEHSDKVLMRIPDFHGISDALVSIRGGEALAFDIIERPDRIDWAAGRILDAWRKAFDEAHAFISSHQAGSVIWLGMWHPGRIEVVQEDYAELLSANQYKQHFMDLDREFCRHVDKAMFHLHNTMMRYQEVALEMPEIAGTQFRPPYDADRRPEPVRNHLELYGRMHEAGKKTWYECLDEEDLADVILHGDPRHVFVLMRAKDGDAARMLMDRACELTAQRKRELGLG